MLAGTGAESSKKLKVLLQMLTIDPWGVYSVTCDTRDNPYYLNHCCGAKARCERQLYVAVCGGLAQCECMMLHACSRQFHDVVLETIL